MATGAMMGPKKSFKSKVAPGDLWVILFPHSRDERKHYLMRAVSRMQIDAADHQRKQPKCHAEPSPLRSRRWRREPAERGNKEAHQRDYGMIRGTMFIFAPV